MAYADSTSDLPLLEAAGFPVAVNPEARLAALARKRGWLVEHFEKSKGGSDPLLPIAPTWRGRTPTEDRPMKALEFSRKPARYAAAMVAGALRPGPAPASGPSGCATSTRSSCRRRMGPLQAPPRRHLRVRPVDHRRPLVALLRTDRQSFPFVPGHEVVGD